MKCQPGTSFPRDVPVIKQSACVQKRRLRSTGIQRGYLRVLVPIFILLIVVLACLTIVTFTLLDGDSDLDHLKTFRRYLEQKIRYWNQHYINKDANFTVQNTRLTKPEKGYIMMSIVKEISRMSKLPYRNLSSSQYHRQLFYDTTNDLCEPEVTCPADVILSPYRTIDGSCNNLNRPYWGMAGKSQKRILRSFFEDDIGLPRSLGIDGFPLPSPRFISNHIHHPGTLNRTDNQATVMVMAFGQFFDHDLMFTPMTKDSNGEPVSCCTDEAKATKGPLESCAPIDIPEVDEHFPPNSCMNFSRSAPSICGGCSLCQREQINSMTSFIDGSQVYGSTVKQCNELREFENGFLKTTITVQGHHILLPRDPETKMCTLSDTSQFCFQAGDPRVNVVPNLSSLHTMFVREHNRIAEQLARINPHWDDELLFQESRKISIAQMQHIVYSEYLPIILGDDTMSKYRLKVSEAAYSDVYDSSVDPRISSSFSAASFRFGHSTVPNHQKALDRSYHVQEVVPIEKTYNNPNMSFSFCNGITRWLVHENAVTTDGLLGHGVRNVLFHNIHHHNRSFDLAALNIQRGRDHGLAPYNYWRHFCKLPVIKPRDFNQTGKWMGDFVGSVSDSFRKVYRHPDDIDLFAGAMRELRLYNAHVGPTFGCLIGKEFQRLKTGDRFYYENPPRSGLPFVGFKENQLLSIKKIKLSKIVCETMNVPVIQPDVFRPSNRDSNPMVSCSDLPSLDFSLWRDN